ncbi:MAG TPA: DUF499 domain-containing protein [Candidatus Mediterraneibacter intestinigallinarum]|nr:DUF499 domain-containing protein [Candidatus Mediterraneibacter intestinigallinarum]
MQENYELVQKGFRILHPILAGYIGRELNREYHNEWWQEVLTTLGEKGRDLPDSGDYADLVDSMDIATCLRLIDWKWNVFRAKLSIDYRTWSKELMGIRNNTAHIGQQDLDSRYAERALDTMALLSEGFGDTECTEKIRALYRTVRYGSADGSTTVKDMEAAVPDKRIKTSIGVLKRNVGHNLPSWREVMQPHPDVAEGRYRAAEFAADLAQVSRGEGAYEYRDPVEFFARTYVTEGMAGLLTESLQRISGKGGEPVIQLKTAFGGGKTHSMLALYHITRGGISIARVPNLKYVLERVGLDEFPRANVAVLVGTALDPTKKKNPANLPKYTVSTIWGEMAYQLVTSAGRPDLYAIVADADRKGVSPGSENLKILLNECGPCLILMDELVAYAKKIYGVEGLPAGSYDNFITFIQEITEAARASENSIVVASIPESEIEIGGEAGKTALETIEHTFGRMESIWKPVAANEGFEVVRRRLFLDCKNEEARDEVCNAFSSMYQENSTDFPIEVKEVSYRDRMVACYPIHPEVFDRLYEDWATLERFQRTRGVLRLMAAVIHELWMANDAGAMIMPGSIPLDMPNVRDELVRHLPDTWNSIIDREVDGKDSIPYQKDRANVRYGQKLAARRVARTIMLGSAPTVRDQAVRGLEAARIRLGVVQPGENISDFNDALNTLHGSLSYLYNNVNGSRYWYDTRPTLRKTAEDRASQVSQESVSMEIESRLKKLRKEQPFAGIHPCPASSLDVPDDQAVRLILLRTVDTYKRTAKSCKAMETVNEILNHRGSSPRIYRNMIAFVAPDYDNLNSLETEVRRFIAWKSIMSEKDELNLDGNQIRETDNNLNRSNQTVALRIKETYCWLLVPFIDPNEDLKTIQWEISNIGGGDENIVAKAAKKMIQNEQVITNWAPALLQMSLDDLLWKDSDDIQIKKLWEYLSTYCYLPRLANYSVLEDAILRGVASDEYFALAGAYNKNRYVDLKYNKTVFSVNPSDLLVKINVALKQIAAEKQEESHTGGTAQTSDQEGIGHGENGSVSGGGGQTGSGNYTGGGNTSDFPQNTRFYMSAKLDTTRVNRDMNNYVQEIIQHLMAVDGSNVELTLEVNVHAPKGIPASTVRTVSENCRTLKITDFGFDD